MLVTTNNTQKGLFARLIAAGIDALKAFDIVSADDTPVAVTPVAGTPVTVTDSSAPAVAVPVQRRRIGQTGSRVVYRLTQKARDAMKDKRFEPSAVMFNTMARTFAAAVQSGKETVSQRELEALTGLGRKTVESTVYHLRTDGWLESVSTLPMTGQTTLDAAVQNGTLPVSGDALAKERAELAAVLSELRESIAATKERRKAGRKPGRKARK